MGDRGREMAEAVLRIVARDGLDAVSMRTVAAEAGRSLGSVQREFASKDELLRGTLIHAIDQMGRRIEERGDDTVRGAFDLMVDEVLPDRPDTVAEGRVWLAFMARAALDDALAGPLRERYARSHTELAGGIAVAQALGQAHAGLDPRREAVALVALADGLTAQILVGIITHDEAARIFRDGLDRVFRPGQEGR